jgi:hypothetical protein
VRRDRLDALVPNRRDQSAGGDRAGEEELAEHLGLAGATRPWARAAAALAPLVDRLELRVDPPEEERTERRRQRHVRHEQHRHDREQAEDEAAAQGHGQRTRMV